MKRTTAFLSIIFGVLFSISAMATDGPGDSPTIKLLPAEKGTIKVLYVNDHQKKVSINIIGIDGVVLRDNIKLGKDDNGFVKNYNLSNLDTGIYWIEVKDDSMSVKYQVTYQVNQIVWAKYWDGMLPANQGLASN